MMKKNLIFLVCCLISLSVWADDIVLNLGVAHDPTGNLVKLNATKNGDGTYSLATIGSGTSSITLNLGIAHDPSGGVVKLSGTKNNDGTFSIATTGGGGGGGSPTGAAGGDLSGTYPNPTVISVADVTTGVLPGANGGVVNGQQLFDVGHVLSLDAGARQLYDDLGIKSEDFASRRLYASNGTTTGLDYSNPTRIRFFTGTAYVDSTGHYFGDGSNLTGIGGGGTVTSVDVTGANGIGVSGSPITTSGTIALSLGAITPTTVNGNTITTGTGTLTLGSFTLTVANTGTAATGTSFTSGNVIQGGGGSTIIDSGFKAQAINNMTDSWTDSATTYNAIKMAITDTASASASLALNILGGSGGTTPIFQVRRDGVFQTVAPFSLQIPDLGTGGGNVRGTNAVDLQYVRNAATQVASGVTSSIGGGDQNTASGTGSSVPGGHNNLASNSYTFAVGNGNTASGNQSIAMGVSSVASGSSSVAISGTADANNSVAIGAGAYTRGVIGSNMYSPANFATAGDAQTGLYLLRRITTDATANVVLTSDNNAPGATNQPVMKNNALYTFDALISARRTDSADYGSWRIVGAIKRDANAASTAILGSPVTTTLAIPTGTWATPSVTADTTNGGLQMQVTGAASQTVRWAARVVTMEVTN